MQTATDLATTAVCAVELNVDHGVGDGWHEALVALIQESDALGECEDYEWRQWYETPMDHPVHGEPDFTTKGEAAIMFGLLDSINSGILVNRWETS